MCAIITDTGSLTHNIQKFIGDKSTYTPIKYNNFIRRNFLVPLSVKISVLDVCVVSISYGYEPWAFSRIKSAEFIDRLDLKRALSIHECSPTEFVYLESNRLPLHMRI